MLVSKTVLLEGAHRTGKSSVLAELCKQSSHLHVVQDRGWPSVYAFGKLFGRSPVNVERAAASFFANPDAVLVHFALGEDKLESSKAADEVRHNLWLGAERKHYANSQLDEHIAYAVDLARQLGFGNRVLELPALHVQSDEAARFVLRFANACLP